MSFDWEDIFPLVSVRKLVRDVSDHNPLLLSTCPVKNSPLHNCEFRFELSWLKNEEFYIKAKNIWEQPVNASDPIDILNIKLKRLKKYFKGWGSHSF
uniref:Endonuclease/exonuclease/phosphatase domain-containing protein n=1 Tax=Aegilops tauschii subsp. strangulata TaxID=200361 RepID=A0A452ZUH0_AEGTS